MSSIFVDLDRALRISQALPDAVDVPTGVSWAIQGVTAAINTNSAAGNRQFVLDLIEDPLGSPELVARVPFGPEVAPSSLVFVNGVIAGENETGFTVNSANVAWPLLVATSGQRIQLGEINAPGGAADTATWSIHYERSKLFRAA